MSFFDLPESAYPFTIEFLNSSGSVIDTMTVEGPGALKIPGLAAEHGPIDVRVTYADGHQDVEHGEDS